MGEVAVSYVSIIPKFASNFGGQIRGEVSKETKAAFGPVEQSAQQKGQQTGKKFGDSFRSVVTPLLTIAAVKGVADFVGKSVDSFAELEDATAAAGVVFGDSMQTIIAQSENAARTMGMSKKEVIDAANTFGTMGKSAGLAGNDLAGFSTQMTQVAADLASFKGGSPEEAVLAVGAAMRGETEPIRRYGVLLDDATLRSRALKLGLIETTKEGLTPQQKVLAAQAEILAQTTDAQGDFARNSESTANVAKTLAAESANLSAELGEKLAPAIIQAQKAGIGLLQWATDNQAVLVPLIGTLGVVTAGVLGFVAAGKAMEAVKAARATIQGLGDAFSAMSSKAKMATLSMGAIGVALTIGAAVYGLFAGAQERAKQASEDFAQALRADSGAIGENTAAMVANRLEKEGALVAAQTLGISSQDLTRAFLEQGQAMVEMRRRILEYTDGTGAQYAAATTLLRVLQEQGGALKSAQGEYQRVTEATAAAAAAAKTMASSTADAKTATADATQTMKDYVEKVRQAGQAQLQLSGSQIALEAAYDDATASVKRNGKTLDDTTEKGRANRTALNNIASAGLSVVESLTKTNASGKRVSAAMADARNKFVAVAEKMGKSRSEAQKLADKLGLIKSKKVDVDVKMKWSGDTSKTISVRGGGKLVRLAVASGGKIPGFALHDRDDKVPALLTPDEWVIKRPSARYYGDRIMAALNAGRIPKERLQGYADGGKVGAASQSLGGTSTADIEAAVARGVRIGLAGAGIRLEGVSRLADSLSARILAASV